MYISIALVLCSWILIYAGGSMKIDRILVQRLKVTRELMELQKEVAYKYQKTAFKVTRKFEIEYKKSKEKKNGKKISTDSIAQIIPIEKKLEKFEEEQNKDKNEKELPRYRVSFFALTSKDQLEQDTRLEKGFLRLWEDILLENISIPRDEKKRFAKEVLRGIKNLNFKPSDCGFELEKLHFDRPEDRALYCALLRSNPSPLDFITLEDKKIPFFNVDRLVLSALFPEVPLDTLDTLRKKTDQKFIEEVRSEIEKITGESLKNSDDPLFKNLEFIAKKKRDIPCYYSVSKHDGVRLWRVRGELSTDDD
jgi:hypothetical protein